MKWWIALALFFVGHWSLAQGILLQRDIDTYHQVDRLIAKNPSLTFHPAMQYYDEGRVSQLAKEILENDLGSEQDRQWSEQWLEMMDPSAKPSEEASWWKRTFFTTPGYLWSKRGDRFYLRLNPMIHFQAGTSDQKDGLLFTNTRGVEISGGIGKKVTFFSNIVETQARFPSYFDRFVEERTAIPGNGFYKRYQSSVVDLEDAYDFLNSTGYIRYQAIPEIGFTLGHGRHHIGSGMRSMLLSDFSNNYFFLQADWTFWRIHYRNIWSEVKPRSPRDGLRDDVVRRKYIASHHLSIAILKNLHFGLFETVVFDRSDQFELGYLNPLILYRTVEQSLGSPDNALLGVDLSWHPLKNVQVYGQVNFDEFVLDELILDNQGWWGNKYGWQAGLKVFDPFGVDHLDLQAEWNGARPYTYTHRDSSASYSHSNMALAHPLGANFEEIIMLLRYQPTPRWLIEYTYIEFFKGLDRADLNYGGNILLPHDTRIMDYDNEIGQGAQQDVNLHRLQVSYQVFPKFWLDANWTRRSSDIENLVENESVFSFGVRWNVGRNRRSIF